MGLNLVKLLVAVLIIASSGIGFSLIEHPGSGYQTSPSDNRPDVVFITLEALNKKHLNCYGYHKNTTPNICRLADDGYRFEKTATTSGITTQSITAMQTGRYPFKTVLSESSPIPASANTTAEALADDYETYLYSGHAALGERNFRQGFESYDAPEEMPRSLQKLDLAGLRPEPREIADRLEGRNGFVRLHVFETHRPYTPVREEETLHQKPLNATERYDNTLRSTDAYVGDIIKELKDRKLYHNSLIIVTADHGEDPDSDKPHVKATPDVVEIPLIIKKPQQDRSRTVERVTTTMDIGPTILHLTDQENISESRVLTSSAYNRSTVKVFSGLSDQPMFTGIYTDSYLASYHKENDSFLIYPEKPLSEEQRRRAIKELKALNRQIREKGQQSIDEDIRKRMRKLGYLDS